MNVIKRVLNVLKKTSAKNAYKIIIFIIIVVIIKINVLIWDQKWLLIKACVKKKNVLKIVKYVQKQINVNNVFLIIIC